MKPTNERKPETPDLIVTCERLVKWLYDIRERDEQIVVESGSTDGFNLTEAQGDIEAAKAKRNSPEGKRIAFRWQILAEVVQGADAGDEENSRSVDGKRILAGFMELGDAEHFAEMVEENPDYETVEIREVSDAT